MVYSKTTKDLETETRKKRNKLLDRILTGTIFTIKINYVSIPEDGVELELVERCRRLRLTSVIPTLSSSEIQSNLKQRQLF